MAQAVFSHFKNYKISVIMPVFNEGRGINERIQILENELNLFFIDYEIIIVSDGSTDETNSFLRPLQNSKIKLIELATNQGKGYSVREGFKHSSGDFLLFIDGGMEIHPKEIKIFFGLLLLYDADIVIGSKRHPQSVVSYPPYRRFLSFLFQLLVRGLFKLNVTDTQVGIKVFRRPVIEKVMPYLQVDRYGFDVELLSYAVFFGFNQILEAPIRLDYFLKQERFVIIDLVHTLRVGTSLAMDTVKLYFRIKKNNLALK